jgi:hypothetical protein
MGKPADITQEVWDEAYRAWWGSDAGNIEIIARAILAERDRCIIATSGLITESRFLLDRLNDLDWSQDKQGIDRDFSGHVSPSVERLAIWLEQLRGEAQ